MSALPVVLVRTGPQLTVADVRDVLTSYEATTDYSALGQAKGQEETDASTFSNVDVPSFARSILIQELPRLQFGKQLTSGQKVDEIDRAVSAYRRIERRSGQEAAFALLSRTEFIGSEKGSPSPSADEVAIAPLASGIDGLSLLFGINGAFPLWTARLEDVSMIGTDTARLSYTATPTPSVFDGKNPLTFKDPAMRYVEELRFERTASGRWAIAAWPNFEAFRRRLESNVEPKEITTYGWGWWNNTSP